MALPVSGRKPKLRRDGQPKLTGRNPASRANLMPPWTSETSPSSSGEYQVSTALRNILRERHHKSGKPNVRAVAESILETALTPDSHGYSTALTQLLDRTEGKVPGDGPAGGDVKVIVVYVDKHAGLDAQSPALPATDVQGRIQ